MMMHSDFEIVSNKMFAVIVTITLVALFAIFFSIGQGCHTEKECDNTPVTHFHNAKTPEALCAEIISVTCDRVRECEPEIERSSCLKIGFSLCAEFTIDLSSTRAVYDICIPKILASSCHELRVKSPPECENLFKQNNPSDAGVNPSIRYPTLY